MNQRKIGVIISYAGQIAHISDEYTYAPIYDFDKLV